MSVGTLVSIADHFHIMLAFFGVLLFLVNIIFWLEPRKSWLESLYMGCMAFNLKGFDDFQIPEVAATRLVCTAISGLSTLFLGFVAAAFLKPFVIVFGHK